MESEPTKDYDAIERAFLAYKGRRKAVDNPGPEWFTTMQFAERLGKSRRAAAEALQNMVNDGILDYADFKVVINERVNMVRHYKNK